MPEIIFDNGENKMNMRNLTIASVLIVTVWLTVNSRAADLDQKWNGFILEIERLHEIERALQDTPEESLQNKAGRALEEISEMHMGVGEAFRHLYLGRLTVLAGRPNESLNYWKEALKHPATAPEAIEAVRRLFLGRQRKIDLREKYETYHVYHSEVFDAINYHRAKILPFSREAKRLDAKIMDERRWDGNPPWGLDSFSVYPHRFERIPHTRIIQSFIDMKMVEWVELACLEMIYYSYEPVDLTRVDVVGRRWFSPQSGALVYWTKAAEHAWLQGKTDEAAIYAAKVFVFGNENTRKTVRELIATWSAQPPPDELPEPQPKATLSLSEDAIREFEIFGIPTDSFEFVIHHYREANLPPRCLELLDKYGKKALGEERTAELRKKIEEEFLERQGQIVIWGQEAGTREEREKITVPEIASEEARRKAAEWLEGIIKLLEEAKAEEKEQN